MKLLRYGPAGEELPGLLDGEGGVRSLRPIVGDIDINVISPEGLNFLEALDPLKLPRVAAPGRLGCPLACVRQIVAIGLNYRDHALEANLPIPAEPVVFNKFLSSISGPSDDILLPPGSEQTDWEIELGIVIGSPGSDIREEDSRKHIAGYCQVNDLSERIWQMERGGQWAKGKSFDSFTPIGPWFVTANEVPDPGQLALKLDVNGKTVQNGTTADMIFDVNSIVSYCSRFMTLRPGDLIITGTPAGVGLGMRPKQFLRNGDFIEMEISGLGRQEHAVKYRAR